MRIYVGFDISQGRLGLQSFCSHGRQDAVRSSPSGAIRAPGVAAREYEGLRRMRSLRGCANGRGLIRDQGVAGSNPVSPTQKAAGSFGFSDGPVAFPFRAAARLGAKCLGSPRRAQRVIQGSYTASNSPEARRAGAKLRQTGRGLPARGIPSPRRSSTRAPAGRQRSEGATTEAAASVARVGRPG
jgi:hypothetical protein